MSVVNTPMDRLFGVRVRIKRAGNINYSTLFLVVLFRRIITHHPPVKQIEKKNDGFDELSETWVDFVYVLRGYCARLYDLILRAPLENIKRALRRMEIRKITRQCFHMDTRRTHSPFNNIFLF